MLVRCMVMVRDFGYICIKRGDVKTAYVTFTKLVLAITKAFARSLVVLDQISILLLYVENAMLIKVVCQSSLKAFIPHSLSFKTITGLQTARDLKAILGL